MQSLRCGSATARLGSLLVISLLVPSTALAAARHRTSSFEPTDLDLEDPLTLELDLQFGPLFRDGEPDLRWFVPDFELQLGLTSRIELEVDGALSFDRNSGHFTLTGDNLWTSAKLGLFADMDPNDPDRAWALGTQLGPMLPTAPHSFGTGFGALLLGARMAAPWHVVVNLGAMLSPIDRTQTLRSFVAVGGLDLDYDLDAQNRWSLLGEIGAGYSFGPDPHDLHATLGLDLSATPHLDFSLVGFYGFLPGGDRLGLLFGVSPKFDLSPART
jgi:hypothetical protein